MQPFVTNSVIVAESANLFQTNGGNRTLLPKTPFPSMVKRLELFVSGLLVQGRVDALATTVRVTHLAGRRS